MWILINEKLTAVQFSKGFSPDQCMKYLHKFVVLPPQDNEQSSSHGLVSKKWSISTDRKGLERSFEFKGFKKAWVGSMFLFCSCFPKVL